MVLPANDDAIRSIRLVTAGIAQAAINGRTERESVDGEAEDFAQAIENEDVFAASAEKESGQEEVATAAPPAASA